MLPELPGMSPDSFAAVARNSSALGSSQSGTHRAAGNMPAAAGRMPALA
jgi:hypothetical protein